MKGQLARSTAKTAVMLGLRVMTQAASLVLLTRLLGPSTYGDFAAIASLAVVFGTVPSLGAGYILLSRGVQDASAMADIWRYAWPLTLLLGAALLIVYVFAGSLLAHGAAPPTYVLLLIGATELLLMPYGQLAGFALQSQEKVPLSQFLLWLPFFLRLLAALPCFWLASDQRLATYAVLQMLAAMFATGLSLWVAQRHVALDWRPRLPSHQELRQGSSYAAMQLIAVNPSEIDKVIAVRAVGAHDAGIYSTTSRILGATALPAIAILLTAQPRLFRHAQQPSSHGRRLIGVIAALTAAWGAACAVVLILGSRFLPYLFGTAYEDMARLMPWMAVIAPFLSLRLAAGTILVAYGHPAERIIFELCGIAVLACGMLALAPDWGVRGLAMANLASEVAMVSVGWWLVTRRLVSTDAGVGS
jgi:O-antigen/teichoic acid export membrane protein